MNRNYVCTNDIRQVKTGETVTIIDNNPADDIAVHTVVVKRNTGFQILDIDEFTQNFREA